MYSIRVIQGSYLGFWNPEYEHIWDLAHVYIALQKQIIANIWLLDGYWLQLNIITVTLLFPSYALTHQMPLSCPN